MTAGVRAGNNVSEPVTVARPTTRRRRRLLFVLPPALGACVVIAIFVSPGLTGVGLVSHSTCVRGPLAGFQSNYFLPAVLVNSPYGGSAWGNGTIPVSFPGAWSGPPPEGVNAVGFGAGAQNGGSLGAFFTVNLSVYSLRNSTEIGPGNNLRCSQAYSIQFANPITLTEAGGQMLGQNNTTDASGSPYAYIGGEVNASNSPFFNNSFSSENGPAVTTCGGPVKSLPLVEPDYLRLLFPLRVGLATSWIPFQLTFVQTFHYVFPANFGTWEVDNLSAQGGPGGGWAFSFSPCS